MQLRANNHATATDMQNGNLVTNYWTDFIANNQNIQPGDLVFYNDPTWIGDTWTHVGIVTGWCGETTWVSTIQNGIQEPLIVDHSGPEKITPDKLPRSIGDTDSNQNFEVVFLRAP